MAPSFTLLANAASTAADSATNVKITNPIDIAIIITYVVGIVIAH